MTEQNKTDQLRIALWHMVDAFKPFTMRPIGAPGSAARAEQENQIAAHKRAREALALSSHLKNSPVSAPELPAQHRQEGQP